MFLLVVTTLHSVWYATKACGITFHAIFLFSANFYDLKMNYLEDMQHKANFNFHINLNKGLKPLKSGKPPCLSHLDTAQLAESARQVRVRLRFESFNFNLNKNLDGLI